ncbi:MAG: Ppx/GppA family phosphatase [Candidatus Sumerlaeaceae bacterium]|nr:Ppx/GppA family phosphatase [Candidatus Sumerlaeaceae bacterium]
MSKPAIRFCAGDIGSNAIKVRVVEAGGGLRKTLFEARYPIRLGASAFESGSISREDIEATVSAFQEIAAMCRSFGVDRTRIVATSAVREAVNREELVNAVEKHTGCQIEVIGGTEEARLLAVGMRPDLVDGMHNLIVDVGGGSTELIYTRTDQEIDTMHSMRLGAVRLYQMVKPGAPVSKKEYGLLEVCVQNLLENTHLPVIAKKTQAVGVAGTLRAICDAKNFGSQRPEPEITFKDLEKLIRALRECTVDEMEERFGVDRKRAQIILPGALIVSGLMDLYSLEKITVSGRGLRDGVIEEMIEAAATGHKFDAFDYAVRIGDKYNFDRAHGQRVAKLADSLFVQLEPLHRLTEDFRELLGYAALLHDVGQFVNYSRHHKHSYYLILNEEFPGLILPQQQIVATIARYHRKSMPGEKHPEYQILSPTAREVVDKCAAILRIADALDREHRQLVHSVEATISRQAVTFELNSKGPVLLELSAAKKKGEFFEKVFGRKAVFQSTHAPAGAKAV